MSSGGGGSSAGKWISAIVGATIAVGAVAITVLTSGSATSPSEKESEAAKKPVVSSTAAAAAVDGGSKKPLAVAQPIAGASVTAGSKPKSAGGGGGGTAPAARPSLGGIRVTDPLFGVLDRLHQSVADQKRDRSDQKTVIHSSARTCLSLGPQFVRIRGFD